MKAHWNQDLHQKAWRFATEAHAGINQTFPGTTLPYNLHIGAVAAEVMAFADDTIDTDLAVQCALLHDTREDTGVTFMMLWENFGFRVAEGVEALTKNDTLPKQEKMQDSLDRIRQQPREIAMVKMADRIVNLNQPPEYWTNEKKQEYLGEAIVIYNALAPAHVGLASRLNDKIGQYKKYIV